MKYAHIVLMVLLIIAMIFSLQGCGGAEADEQDKGPFVVVYKNENYDVLRHADTGVMYVMSRSSYNRGNFTLIVDSDGKPLVYKDGV